MVLLGVILMLLGAGTGVVAYLAARGAASTVTATAFGFSRNVTAVELVIYGAVAVLLFALGWAMLSAAARRRVRRRREDKESARLTEVEEDADTARRNHERELQEAGLREEDLRRRENELAARHEGLDTREAELTRREAEWRDREAEWRDRESPSVADRVTGRADESRAARADERPVEARDERGERGSPA